MALTMYLLTDKLKSITYYDNIDEDESKYQR